MRRILSARQSLALAVSALLAIGVAWASPASASNDPLASQQWALGKIHSEASWGRSTGDGVVVAVIDTGVNFDHEDLRGASAGSFTCMGGACSEGGVDDNGHGTEVAGIIAARANNGVGIAGVAPGAKILSIKSLDKDGSGDINDVAVAVRFAAEHGAKVINLSLGSDLPTALVFNLLQGLLGGEDPFQGAINYATTQGTAVVAAAGNGGLASGFTGLQNLLLVGATGPDDAVAGYSSDLLGVGVHAPGGDAAGKCDEAHCILTTGKDGAYTAVQGTSFAAPHVSGVVAQLVALGFSPLGATARIVASASDAHGVRMVDAETAVQGDPLVTGVPAIDNGPAGGLPGLGNLPLLGSLPGLGGLPGLPGLNLPLSGLLPLGGGVPAPAAWAPAAAAPAAAPAPAPATQARPPVVGTPVPVEAQPGRTPAVTGAAPDGAGSGTALASSTVPVSAPRRLPRPLAGLAALFLVLAAWSMGSCRRLARRPTA